ncbi:MAG: hypothetical protein GJ680_07440 [Alteromonadaceae bacterium]|nr:hypothetical protein [Alteromonadaceae bacterium]
MSEWHYKTHFEVIKASSKQNRASNREHACVKLQHEGIRFTTANGGVHLIVQGKSEVIDYWPGTGKWRTRQTKQSGRGLNGVLQRCERRSEQSSKH